ncbi:MAG: (Na+)-NQR maturation NqrM [Granulosicoccus sp.]|nr:(Na+)-NQR maturation NqrM [Granulosicoccus sp.]
MALFLITFGIMVLAVLGMAIGVIFGRTPIAGSCGGLNAVDGSGTCQSCSRPCAARRKALVNGKN